MRLMRSVLCALAAALLISAPSTVSAAELSVGSSPAPQHENLAPAPAPQRVPAPVSQNAVNQGDGIVVGGVVCTIGYVHAPYAYTAGHCLPKEGAPVEDFHGHQIGTAEDIHNSVQRSANASDFEDWGRIRLKEDFRGGKNVFSGDTIASHVKVGDSVTSYGVYSKKPSSGAVMVTGPNGFDSDIVEAVGGDSGGPTWVEGKGLVGLISTGITVKGTSHAVGTGHQGAWIFRP